MLETLFLGQYSYSSWSMRIGLLLDRFDLDIPVTHVDFSTKEVAEQLTEVAPARFVPTWRDGNGAVIWDSLAIAEELASRFPDKTLWPEDPSLRGLARALSAEMHSGFGALREDCPMNLRLAYSGFEPSGAVRGDLARIDTIWTHALQMSSGPWLCGAYSIADAFFAPVAARIATYDLPVSQTAQDYVARQLSDPAFRRWRAVGEIKGQTLPWYLKDLPERPWPGPAPRAAKAVESGPSENVNCPYSGKPVAHYLETEGRVFGFCNPGCRDKTLVDPDAFPKFTALL